MQPNFKGMQVYLSAWKGVYIKILPSKMGEDCITLRAACAELRLRAVST